MFFFPSPPFFEKLELPLSPLEFRSVYHILMAAFIGRNSDMQHFVENDALDGKAGNIRPVIGLRNRNEAVSLTLLIDVKRLI